MAEHFNALNELTPMLRQSARRLLQCFHDTPGITPNSDAFTQDFDRFTQP